MKFKVGDIVHCDNERSWFFEDLGMVVETIGHNGDYWSYIIELWNDQNEVNQVAIVNIPETHLKKYQPFYTEVKDEVSNRR